MPVVEGLADGAPPFAQRLQKTRTSTATSRSSCQAGDKRGAKRGLKGGLKQLTRLRVLLKSKRGKALPTDVRTELLAAVQALRTDVRTLRSALVCPADAE